MNKRLRSEKGEVTLAIIAVMIMVLIFTIPIINLLYSVNSQARIQIDRIQRFYDIKAELARLASTLESDYEYLHNNPSGSFGILNYEVEDEVYSEKYQDIYNEVTGETNSVLISRKYTYICNIVDHLYEISAEVDVNTGLIEVRLLK